MPSCIRTPIALPFQIVLLSFPAKSTRFEMPSRKKIGRPKGKNHSNERVIMMKNLFSTTINCQHGFQKSENVLSILAFLPKSFFPSNITVEVQSGFVFFQNAYE